MEAVVVAVATGLISAVATVMVLKTDMTWIKSTVNDHEERLRSIERGHTN